MPSHPDLHKHVPHRIARLDLAPVGEEEVHLDLSYIFERGRERREHFIGDVGYCERLDDVLKRSLA